MLMLTAVVVLASACSGDRGIAIPSSPTLDAAASKVGGAASTAVAAASPVATSAAQVGSTAISQAGPAATTAANLGATAVSAAGPVATSAANVGATAASAAPPVVTRVATVYAQAAATADARTPLNGAGPSPEATARPTGSPPDGSVSTPGAASGLGAGNAAVSAAPPPTSEPPVRIAGAGLVAAHPALTLQNTTDAALDLTGWRIGVGGETVGLPPSTRVEPRGLLTVHLADGGSRGSEVYLGRNSADLLRGLPAGERATLFDPAGRPVSDVNLPQL